MRTYLLMSLAALLAAPAIYPKSIKKLKAQLNDKRPEVRNAACEALGRKKKKARSARDAVSTKLTDSDPMVRISCAAALVRIDKKKVTEALPILLKALESEEWSVRAYGAARLGSLRKLAKPALEKLTRLTKDSNVAVAASARDAISKIK